MRYPGGKHFLAVLPCELHAALRLAANSARTKGVRANINRTIVEALLAVYSPKMKAEDVRASREFIATHMNGKRSVKVKTNTFHR